MTPHEEQFFAALHELDEAFTRVQAAQRQLGQAAPARYPAQVRGRELNDGEQIRLQRAAELRALSGSGRAAEGVARRPPGREHACGVRLKCDARPFLSALRSLDQLAERFPEAVQGFLEGLDTLSQLVRIHQDRSAATETGEVWLVFEPSDLLSEWLSDLRNNGIREL